MSLTNDIENDLRASASPNPAASIWAHDGLVILGEYHWFGDSLKARFLADVVSIQLGEHPLRFHASERMIRKDASWISDYVWKKDWRLPPVRGRAETEWGWLPRDWKVLLDAVRDRCPLDIPLLPCAAERDHTPGRVNPHRDAGIKRDFTLSYEHFNWSPLPGAWSAQVREAHRIRPGANGTMLLGAAHAARRQYNSQATWPTTCELLGGGVGGADPWRTLVAHVMTDAPITSGRRQNLRVKPIAPNPAGGPAVAAGPTIDLTGILRRVGIAPCNLENLDDRPGLPRRIAALRPLLVRADADVLAPTTGAPGRGSPGAVRLR